jgi:hypothetical protein
MRHCVRTGRPAKALPQAAIFCLHGAKSKGNAAASTAS